MGKRGTIEVVTWRDAHFSFDASADVTQDYLVRSVGWVSQEGRWLLIDSERTPDGPRGRTAVPLENVLKREVLK